LGVHSGNLISKQPWDGVNLSIGGALRNLPQEASGRQPPPLSPINKGRGLSLRIQHFFCNKLSLEISEEKKKEGENPSRGASVMLTRRFRDRFHGCSSSFFVHSSLFFALQPVSFQIWIFQFILCTFSGPFLFCMLSFLFRLLLLFFSSAFNEISTVYLSRYLA